MRNLDISDSRNKLEQYAAHGHLDSWSGLVGELPPGGAAAIATAGADETEKTSDDALDRAAMESGVD